MAEKGIDLTLDLSKDLGSLIKEGIKNYRDDGRISTPELLGMVDEVFAVIVDFTQIGSIVEEFKDLDTGEGQQLLNYAMDLGILAEKAREIVRGIVNFIKDLFDSYVKNIKPIIPLFKKDIEST